MRAIVDHERCNGHGRCFAVAPHLFDVDDDGYSVVDELAISVDDEDDAREAAGACPSQAIQLVN
jgi:ferredoxin